MLSAVLVIWLIIAIVLVGAVLARFAEEHPGNMTVHEQEDDPPDSTGDGRDTRLLAVK